MTSSTIHLRSVTKIYDGPTPVRALDGVSIDFTPGLTVVAGPSGSGKTTLLALLSAFERPTSGHIVVHGQDLGTFDQHTSAAFRRERIGFVFQDFKLFRVLDATDNVALPLRLLGYTRRAARARAQCTLASVGLHDHGHAFPATLSGGEQQRVAIARALVTSPALVLADEPTANLDWASGRTAVALLAQAAHDGATVILVSHDPRVAERADRVINMLDGRLVIAGYKEEVA